MSTFRPSRRELLAGAAAAGAVGLWPSRARAADAEDRTFVIIHCFGGWDVTRALHGQWDNEVVDMEASATPRSSGELSWVSHPNRPLVDQFLDTWGSRVVLLNGIAVPAVDHFSATRIVLTGSSSAEEADWAATLAGGSPSLPTPQLVLGGPSFPGKHRSSSVRVGQNGQLGKLGKGAGALVGLPTGAFGPSSDESRLLAREWLARRAAAAVDRATGALAREQLEAFEESIARMEAIEEAVDGLDFASAEDFHEQLALSVAAMAEGICRVVSLPYPGDYDPLNWDSHSGNDGKQSRLFEGLFEGLGVLWRQLEETAAPSGGTLADQTVVVVTSEMCRTPSLNAVGGKDHWPWTSAMVMGAGVAGGRVIGRFDESFAGVNVDMASGEEDAGGVQLTPEVLGATLLALGGVDPEERVPGVPVLTSLLA